jgi:uncharacterized protein
MIVADTGAMLALLDVSERHHGVMREIFEANPRVWILPWVILPEMDYMLGTRVGHDVQSDFLAEIAEGAWQLAQNTQHDLVRAHELHAKLGTGFVDGVVMATAERLGATAIATLDMRHFATAPIRGKPWLLPRDLHRL